MAEYYAFEKSKNMKPMSITETQDVALAILDELDSFCKERGINYYLIGGSLIGAIRSKDLVAWDDDIDVAMLRPEYERFCKEYLDSEAYCLMTSERCSNYRHGMAKLVDNSTFFDEHTTRDSPFGVFVDVFPLDNVKSPNSLLVGAIMMMRRIYSFAFVRNREATKNSYVKNLIRIILSSTVGKLSHQRALMCIESFMKCGRGGYLINHWGTWGRRECAPKDCFSEVVSVELRGKEYLAPVGYDVWLRNVYGDYMTPPADIPKAHGQSYWIK